MTTEMSIERITREIERAYDTYTTQYANPGGWMMLSEIANRTDLTSAQITEGVKHLTRSREFLAIPESNRRMLTPEQRAASIWLGGQCKHLIARV